MDRELHARIVRLAREAGMENNKFGFVTQLVEESIKRRQGRKTAPAKA